ncbi:tetratricopeptide repeat protein [Calycomorphotria hydatis]|uniref:Lipoprotein NlpI n=1 Tax=Calycomorphotria hydatis TaxID=2528027 RepID=A0A517T5X9_9PLAN|nr:tetratricopeptide repeat protein [Calycomorphotria hydatis]QDT63774.1 lipoprotein NlpI [Calycomorphotria hydatis]
MGTEVENDDLMKKARALVREKKYGPAIEVMWILLADNPEDADLHNAIASIYFMSGEYDAALTHYERILKLSPMMMGKAQVNIGALYNCMGRHKEALEILRKGVMREKKSAEGFYNLGLAHRKLGQNPMAISAFKEAIKINPSFLEAYQNLGNAFLESKNYQQAIMQFEKALTINPKFTKARVGLQEAEQSSHAAKKDYGPFGRLVDVSRLKRADSAEASERTMSQDERERDRTKVHNLSREIQTAAGRLVSALREDLDPALHVLEKMIVQGRNDRTLLETTIKYQQIIEKCDEQRMSLRRKVLELWGHEELHNTPVEEKAEATEEDISEEESDDFSNPFILPDEFL